MNITEPAPEILFRDEHVLAVAKPAGWLAHPSPMAPDAESLLGWARAKAGAWVYPAHRLDRPTSGVMLFGRSPEAASVLGEALRGGHFDKRYLAVVRGTLVGEGMIEKDVQEEDGGRKPAITLYKALAHTELPWAVRPHPTARYTVVALAPVTGRRHQLRQHLKALAHPIIGDTRYGDGAHNRAWSEHGVRRLLLHAFSLEFPSLLPEGGQVSAESTAFDAAYRAALAYFPAARTSDAISALMRGPLWSVSKEVLCAKLASSSWP